MTNTISTTTINPHLLTTTAFDILCGDLERRSNVLSEMHRAALWELLDAFTGYCTGTQSGRQAFGLPTGMGKTSAVVAFIAALYRLRCPVPLSVAASKVEALCSLKRDLIDHGVPTEAIGLKHAVVGASLPSTGSDSYPVQLVTHARVRSGRDFELFGEHHGERRKLMIYDETLLRADSFAFPEAPLRAKLPALRVALETANDPTAEEALRYLTRAVERIGEALRGLRTRGDANANGAAVDLEHLDEDTVTVHVDAVQRMARSKRITGVNVSDLVHLLEVSQEPLRVLMTEQGDGVVAMREAVPLALRDVVILDASTPVRRLVHMDPTIRPAGNFPADTLKTFEDVEVHQLLSAGGRSTVEERYSGREASAVSREVVDVIKDNADNAGSFLLFTFKDRPGGAEPTVGLRRDLQAAGVDLDEKTGEGMPRFEFLTWGNETGLNGYEHCTVVIMAGVLHRSHLDIASAVRGQTSNPAEPTPNGLVREVIETEVAHLIYQGASRGSCRRVDQGKARPMKLYLVHKHKGLKALLDPVMPGAQWHYPDPRHLQKAASEGKADEFHRQLVGHLQTLGPEVDKIPTRRVKLALGIPQTPADAQAWKRGLQKLDSAKLGWVLDGQCLIRGAARYGFNAAP